MKYELVLQFPAQSEADYDTMTALEEALNATLGEAAEVDGHDVGADTMNLFILTDDPDETFRQVKPLLERREQLEWMTAAYRQLEASLFTIIWPPGCRKEFRIA
jgi:hypothetical protein